MVSLSSGLGGKDEKDADLRRSNGAQPRFC